MNMKIGGLARETGASPRLLRYYEEQGLLTSHRVGGGHRWYADDAPIVVGHIKALLAAGLPTRVIREVLPCVESPGMKLQHCAAPTLQDHLRDLDRKISVLQNARSALTSILTAATVSERSIAV